MSLSALEGLARQRFSPSSKPNPETVVKFWREAGHKMWFGGSAEFDDEISFRFLDWTAAAGLGELDSWQETPEGTFALLIMLDQFPRNMFRGSRYSYDFDAKAREVMDAALKKSFDEGFSVEERKFFYLPAMHAEDRKRQEQSLDLFYKLGDPEWIKRAEAHASTIAEFGRYPHRNADIGRKSTMTEELYLIEMGMSAWWPQQRKRA